jgi:hypothetical protein
MDAMTSAIAKRKSTIGRKRSVVAGALWAGDCLTVELMLRQYGSAGNCASSLQGRM